MRIQSDTNPTTKQLERLEVFDDHEITDPVTGEKHTQLIQPPRVLTPKSHPKLFEVLNAEIASEKACERRLADLRAEHKARKDAEAKAKADADAKAKAEAEKLRP